MCTVNANAMYQRPVHEVRGNFYMYLPISPQSLIAKQGLHARHSKSSTVRHGRTRSDIMATRSRRSIDSYRTLRDPRRSEYAAEAYSNIIKDMLNIQHPSSSDPCISIVLPSLLPHPEQVVLWLTIQTLVAREIDILKPASCV